MSLSLEKKAVWQIDVKQKKVKLYLYVISNNNLIIKEKQQCTPMIQDFGFYGF